MEFTNLKNYLHEIVRTGKSPSVDCLVYKDHELCFRHFEGMADVQAGRELRGDELYIIYSMTKMLTCTAALQLLEQGKYCLDDPIARYLPEFENMQVSGTEFDLDAAAKITTGQALGETGAVRGDYPAEQPITVRHLFTMAAGFDYNLQPMQQALQGGSRTTRALVSALSRTVLGFEPGTRFRYSLCHDILGVLVEVWSGLTLGQYMQRSIFTPLGMKDTFFGVPTRGERLSRMAALYSDYDKAKPQKLPLENGFQVSPEYESGGAGLVSCPEDYALFLDAMACGGVGRNGVRILSEESVKLMGSNHLKGRQLDDFHYLRLGYGYGLGVRVHMDSAESGSRSPVGEFGWDGAAGAFSMADPIHHLSLTYFQHVLSWDPETHKQMRNALYRDLAEAGVLK